MLLANVLSNTCTNKYVQCALIESLYRALNYALNKSILNNKRLYFS